VIVLAGMPHAGSGKIAAGAHCSQGTSGNWYDAPWIGLSHGELIRSGKFGGCNCYSKDPAHWELADGCGQFNVFETVNDNNAYRNLDLFNTNFFSYAGYVGEGPCGPKCDVTTLDPAVDLISKSTAREAQAAVATPQKASNTTFRRPSDGYRWFVILLDSQTRTVQLALAHPGNLPQALATVTGTSVTSTLPSKVGRAAIDGLIAMRLPGQPSTSLFRK
jgi:hypothetical protein